MKIAHTVALGGETTRWSTGPPVIVVGAVPVATPSAPWTLCGPAAGALQLAPVHEPSGESENVVCAVTSPRLAPALSNPVAIQRTIDRRRRWRAP
jgi:hypothetical protein